MLRLVENKYYTIMFLDAFLSFTRLLHHSNHVSFLLKSFLFLYFSVSSVFLVTLFPSAFHVMIVSYLCDCVNTRDFYYSSYMNVYTSSTFLLLVHTLFSSAPSYYFASLYKEGAIIVY